MQNITKQQQQQKKKQLREEKIQLEQSMEREQEFAINRLRRQLEELQQGFACIFIVSPGICMALFFFFFFFG